MAAIFPVSGIRRALGALRASALAAMVLLTGPLHAQAPDVTDPIPTPVRPRPAPGFPIDTLPPDDPNSTVTPTASASFDPPIGRVGRALEYRVVIMAGQRVLTLPERPRPPVGMAFLPFTAPSAQTVPLNGAIVFKTTHRFRVEVEAPGNYIAPAFRVKVGNQEVQVPATHVTVQESNSESVRAVLDLPKRDFFVGETVQGRIVCLDSPDEQALSLQHLAKTSGPILLKGGMRGAGRQNFTWEGKPVGGVVMPVEITPTLAGEGEAYCQVQVYVQRKDGFSRDAFVRSGGIVTVDTAPVRLKILPLPQTGRPPGFTGAIGKFSVGQPQLSAKEVEVGEPIAVLLELRGTGNIDGVPAPEFPAQADWLAYRPTSNYESDEQGGGGGVKNFTFTLVPKRAGLRSTPALPFAYFDPEARVFRDISIPPLPITVKAGAQPAAGETAKAETPAVVDAPSEVPPALTGLAERPGRWLNSPAPALRSFLIAQLVPPLLLVALWAWRRRNEYLAHNPGVIRRRHARAAAKAALSAARAAAQRNDFPAFLTAGLGALREAAAPLDSAQAGSLTREEVLRQLRDDQRAARAADSFFQSAEASRYASDVATTANPSAMLPELEHAVRRLTALA